jgi:hypothetical protein
LSQPPRTRFGRFPQFFGAQSSSQSHSLFEEHAPLVFAYTVAQLPARHRQFPGGAADSLQPTLGGAGPGRHAVAAHSLFQWQSESALHAAAAVEGAGGGDASTAGVAASSG